MVGDVLDRKAFAALRAELSSFDSSRDDIIKQSRDILRSSKAAIYALHRSDAKGAQKALADAQKAISRIGMLVKADNDLSTIGALNEALAEYAEAACFHSILASGRLPTASQLRVPAGPYLEGVADLTGELSRRAIREATAGNTKEALAMLGIVQSIHDELLLFDFRNGTLRKKFDSIKYELAKLEDLACTLSLRKECSHC